MTTMQLSDRQLAIAPMLAQGLSTPSIARQLELSVHTIDKHIRALNSKLSCATRAELVARLYHLRILDVERWPPALSTPQE